LLLPKLTGEKIKVSGDIALFLSLSFLVFTDLLFTSLPMFCFISEELKPCNKEPFRIIYLRKEVSLFHLHYEVTQPFTAPCLMGKKI
jgi:hypothetical protein